MGILKLKKVSKEPKFKSTDGKVTQLDDFYEVKGKVSVENWCVNCGKAIKVGAKVCPYCLSLQRNMKQAHDLKL